MFDPLIRKWWFINMVVDSTLRDDIVVRKTPTNSSNLTVSYRQHCCLAACIIWFSCSCSNFCFIYFSCCPRLRVVYLHLKRRLFRVMYIFVCHLYFVVHRNCHCLSHRILFDYMSILVVFYLFRILPYNVFWPTVCDLTLLLFVTLLPVLVGYILFVVITTNVLY